MIWYKNWFDSKYYHILYKNRNQKEAQLFIENLLKLIKPKKNFNFLDIGCGTGRHAIQINKKGFKVDGIDLSKKSLNKAEVFANKNLNFYHTDMRNIKYANQYHVVLNLFTSFGYFDDKNDDTLVFQNIYKALKKNGYFIIDFLNANKILKTANKKIIKEEKKINNILFKINKYHDGYFVYKKIMIIDKNEQYIFTEKVRLIKKEVFIKYQKKINFDLKSVFGDYNLNPYKSESSDRLILIFQKNH